MGKKLGKTDSRRAESERLDIPVCWQREEYRAQFRRQLVGWFLRHQRDFPWRRTKDPYAIWVSEIMLQQTQALTVVRYFERFLAAFPTVQALAQAEPTEVLRLWEGLGYYRRAVQLHEAAKKIVAEFGGQFPLTPEQLCQLPGIGRYTAGAILSIAFDQPQPILEANTLRLWARLLACRKPPQTKAAQQLFWHMAEWVLPRRQVGRFNQALMELGSTVCLPREPRCSECPVDRFCLAFQQGQQTTIPPPREKTNIQFCHEAALIVRRNDQVLLRAIPEGERWAGLWEFPRFPWPSGWFEAFPTSSHRSLTPPVGPGKKGRSPGARSSKQSRTFFQNHVASDSETDTLPQPVAEFFVHQMAQCAGIVVRPIRWLTTIPYAVTRYRIQMDCYEAEYVGPVEQASEEPPSFTVWEGLADLGWPSGRRREASSPPPLGTEGNKPEKSPGRQGSPREPLNAKSHFRWVGLTALASFPMSSPARKLARVAQTRTNL